MSLKSRLAENVFSGSIGAGLALLVGLLLSFVPVGQGMVFGQWLVNLSYDLPFAFGPNLAFPEAVIIYMDESSHQDLGQHYGQMWDRSLHARLLDRLTMDGARLVVFDVFFAQPGTNATADDALAQAINRNGNVVLAGEYVKVTATGARGEEVHSPVAKFLDVAKAWGIPAVLPGTDSTIREDFSGTEVVPTVPWVAAELAHAPVTTNTPALRLAERWLNHYGAARTIPTVSYSQAWDQPANYFKDKTIFIGGKPPTLYTGEYVDVFRTPHTRWGRELSPGVDIEATVFLNLMRGDWLTRCSASEELFLLLVCGLLFGFGLCLFRPATSASLAFAGIGAVVAVAVVMFWQRHVWFPWTILAGAQIPCALGWSALHNVRRLQQQRDRLESALRGAGGFPLVPQRPRFDHGARGDSSVAPVSGAIEAPTTVSPCGPQVPAIPDHELLRCIGRGAYGEVWLARNVIGMYRAVKIVYRKNFSNQGPFDREFNGIQKFTPVSLSHAGLVHVLQVGRNLPQGYFYSVMELGDDEQSRQVINSESYSPKNLAREIKRRGKLPVSECLDVGLALTAALEFLHQQKLIHRDIKPSNIIFVNGAAKLADIGLVTDIASTSGDATYLGTEGYIAPEGPGTAAADVFSLGKVIYEASMGRDRLQFPELPTTLDERPDSAALLQLNEVILKACEPEVRRRYRSAGEMHAALLRLKQGPP